MRSEAKWLRGGLVCASQENVILKGSHLEGHPDHSSTRTQPVAPQPQPPQSVMKPRSPANVFEEASLSWKAQAGRCIARSSVMLSHPQAAPNTFKPLAFGRMVISGVFTFWFFVGDMGL